ncbi:hypothetical protein GGP41_002228 [Bipolaris sorokiniana]|uniref:Uncharacterized protein n=1 Tax=Cochliobolus sativus TaxID=45130 RepID=A0A8H5Z7M1_COCSA|nr:hypothetical protein GGP41_002228 [Bipolaris sorokiniana]
MNTKLTMKFLTVISALCAGSLALNVLQEDNTIRNIKDTELVPRQFPSCCSNGFAPPCACPGNCGSGCSRGCC